MGRNKFSHVGLLLSVSVVVTFLGGMEALAQTAPPEIEWEKTYDANNGGWSVQQTSQIGHVADSVGPPFTPHPGADRV